MYNISYLIDETMALAFFAGEESPDSRTDGVS